jgi:hypothetical protein
LLGRNAYDLTGTNFGHAPLGQGQPLSRSTFLNRLQGAQQELG